MSTGDTSGSKYEVVPSLIADVEESELSMLRWVLVEQIQASHAHSMDEDLGNTTRRAWAYLAQQGVITYLSIVEKTKKPTA